MRKIAASTAAVLLLAGCSSSAGGVRTSHAPSTSAPKPITVSGVIVVPGADTMRQDDADGTVCWTSGNSPLFPSPGPLDEVKAGAQVVIADSAGQTVGIGTVGNGATMRAASGKDGDFPDCAFHFAASGVPAGMKFYAVKVGSHSVQVPGDQIEAPTVTFG